MIEYNGYQVGQAPNHHIWITKNGKMVLHSQCNKTKTDDELREIVDNYIKLISSEICEEPLNVNDDEEVDI